MANNERKAIVQMGYEGPYYGKTWDVGTTNFEHMYYGSFSPLQQHRYIIHKDAHDLSQPCVLCGRELLAMLQGRYGNAKGFVHNNVKVTLHRRDTDMGYEIEAYVPESAGFYDEPKSSRSRQRVMAFNQFSQLLQRARQDHNLLDQDEVWVNRDGIKVLLKDMSARYASNVLAWLRKASKEYHSSWATWEFVTKYSDQSATDFEELLDETITDAKAREWIKGTKLYQALTDISKHSV